VTSLQKARLRKQQKRGIRKAATITIVTAVGLSAAGCGNTHGLVNIGCRVQSVDKRTYVAKNEAILRGLPIYPGSHLVNTYAIANPASDKCLPFENGPPYDGYTTERRYASPPHTPRGAVARFYHRRLPPTWKLTNEGQLRRGDAQLSIDESTGYWFMKLDHAFFSRYPPVPPYTPEHRHSSRH
jgi:hypothetical protein